MNKKIEILAPAGSYEGMKAAMNAGCDAVYIGGSSFGARAFANNLDEEVLLRAIDEAHIREKNLYLTVNTLIKEKEMTDKLYLFLEKFYLQGLDAVIVQDIGVMNFIHTHFPKLSIHASTQTTITMAEGSNLIKELGVTRIVTPRELSLKEIRKIRENTDLEIETFVYGALCYCYSGQCLMSSMIGGRSGNRGRCAQPCRMPYELYSDGVKLSGGQEKYLLSPKDINTLAILPELVEAGIDSFKIEGRMKRPEYAAIVSAMYQKYLDLYYNLGKDRYYEMVNGKEYKQDFQKLMDIYNRGSFSEGYFNTYHGKTMMSMNRPNHNGVFVGEVSTVKGSQVSIRLKEDINAQDILDIRSTEEAGYEFTVKSSLSKGETLITNVGRKPGSDQSDSRGKRLQKAAQPFLYVGDKVYRTKNNFLLEQIADSYMLKEQKIIINGVLKAKKGERLELSVSFNETIVIAYHDEVQAALKQPMSKEKLSAPIKKTGDTIYTFDNLMIIADDDIFVPVSGLNEIRRDVLNKLQEAVAGQYRREEKSNDKEDMLSENKIIHHEKNNVSGLEERIPSISNNQQQTIGFCVCVQTIEQFFEAVRNVEVTSIYVEYDFFSRDEISDMVNRAVQADKGFYLVLPHICRDSVYEGLKREILTLLELDGIKGFVSKNFEETWLLQSLMKVERIQKEMILDYNMYVFNSSAKDFWRKKGITHYTAPVELNYQELKILGVTDSDFIVYGYLPMMISAQCLFDNTKSCKKGKNSGKSHTGYLVDRLGKKFYIQTNCRGCYNRIYNGQCLSLHKQSSEIKSMNPKNIRLNFTLESAEEMKQILQTFINIYKFSKKGDFELVNYTAGHFNRGIE